MLVDASRDRDGPLDNNGCLKTLNRTEKLGKAKEKYRHQKKSCNDRWFLPFLVLSIIHRHHEKNANKCFE